MDGSLWLESHLKADGPKCVVLAFLCCPDPYYCLILDSQFSLFFLFFWLMIWLRYVVSCVLAESEGGVLIFEWNQEYTNDPQWFSVLCLEKRTIQHTLVHQLSRKDEVFHGLLLMYSWDRSVPRISLNEWINGLMVPSRTRTTIHEFPVNRLYECKPVKKKT